MRTESKQENTAKTEWFIFFSILIIAGLLSLTACGGTASQGAEDGTEQTEAPAVAEEVWKDAYRQVLEDNENDIRSYEVGEYDSGAGSANALCDLNHDGLPELLFFSWAEENVKAELSIYTCRDGWARKLHYAFTDAIPAYSEADNSEKPYYDLLVAGGTKYIVYTEGQSGRFAIYSTITDENIVAQMNRYQIDEECNISQIENLGYNYQFVKFDGDTYIETSDEVDLDDAEMYRNGEKVSKADFLTSYKDSRDAMEEVIFCSKEGERGDDKGIWEKAESIGASALSYDEMMEKLRVSTDEEEKADYQSRADAENGETMEKLLEAYGQGDMQTVQNCNSRLPEKADRARISAEEQAAFDAVYDELESQGRLSEFGSVQYLCDVDNDGKAEYLIQTGDCEANFMLQCYKYENGNAVWIGETGSGHSSFHQYPDHRGIIQEIAHMGYEAINVVTFDNGKSDCREIGSRGELNDVEDYLSLGCLLEQ